MTRALPGMRGVEIPDSGFFYHDPTHRYFMNGERMTGVTTIVDNVGDKSNLIQWAANQAAANAFMKAAEMDMPSFKRMFGKYKRLGSREVLELDKAFPLFREARLASTRVKDAAADSGKEAHKLCELYQQGEALVKEGWTPEAWKRFTIWRDWYDANVGKTHFVERPLFSKEHFVGGTPDGGWLMKDGRNLIQDNKFKPYIYDPTPFRQMAAYRLMIEEMANDTTTPIHIDWGEGRVEHYANPQQYLGSLGEVVWHGAVVVRVGEDDFEEMHADTYESDKRGFLAALEIYRENGAFKNRLAQVT